MTGPAKIALGLVTALACGGCLDEIACDQIERDMEEAVAGDQTCKLDGDCQFASSGCAPAALCGRFVNSDTAQKLAALLDDWDMHHCGGTCIACPPPPPAPPACNAGRAGQHGSSTVGGAGLHGAAVPC